MRGHRDTVENLKRRVRGGVWRHVLSSDRVDEFDRRLSGVSVEDREVIYEWYAETYLARLRTDNGRMDRLPSCEGQLLLFRD